MRKGYCGGLGWNEEIWVKFQLGQFGEESANGGFGDKKKKKIFGGASGEKK